MSYGEIAWRVRGRQPRRSGLRPLSHRPGISVLVPAFNEQEIVVTTVSALLQQDYAPLEVVVVDDGSTDATFERLDAAFDALIRALRPFEEQPDGCLAVGGSIRVANRSRIAHGRVRVARIGGGIEAMQTLEYVRGFLGTRVAWSRLNGLLIVSGAFGLFRRETLIDIGGYLPSTMGEDMELTVRLHHRLRPDWPEASVLYAADAICWTQAPSALSGLRSQRMRWQVGLLETIALHRAMLGRARYGASGLLALPYLACFEAIAPLIQIGGWTLTTVLLIVDPSAWPWVAAMLLITLLFVQVQTLLALLDQETAFHGYSRRDLTRLLVWGLLECFWYHPLLAIWRTSGTVRLALGRRPEWGEIPREALEEAPTALTPLTR